MKQESTDISQRSRGMSPFLALFIALSLIIGAVETVLLGIKYDYFRGGFLAREVLNTFALRTAFAGSSIILDAALILLLWALFIPLFSRILHLSNSRLLIALALPTLAVPFACDYVNYELRAYLSDAMNLGLVWELSGRSLREVISQWGSHLTYSIIGMLLGLAASAAIIIIWRRDEIPGMERFARSRPPSLRKVIGWAAVTTATAMAIISAAALLDSPVYFGLTKKPGGIALRNVIQWVSDLDRDGYGFMSRPRDPAPLNSRIYPYAVEIPGNGIDQNGVAGDLPADSAPAADLPDETSPWVQTPNVLLILLESVRGDVLERNVNGREIAPFMRKLATKGAQSKLAYSHCGSTVPSRAQLFGGRIQPYPGQSTLIDDFKRNGYYVAYFSGQDDSFGDSGPLVGYDKADTFYDARADKDKRYSQFSTPASLAVSCKLVNRRVLSFLDQYEPARPLFLYVNYHDTHFPYHHRELDNILGIDPLPRDKIKPGASEGIWKTYANSAANVDRAIMELFSALRQKLRKQPLLVLIVSDHAQSLFENGFLGHGYSLDDEQTRIPFVVWGVPTTWHEPLGLADVRGQLLQNLVSNSVENGDRPQVIPDPSRRVLQHIGPFRSPRLLAWRSLDKMTVYDFWNDMTLTRENGAGSAFTNQSGLPAGLVPLIWDWESTVRAQPPALKRPKDDQRWHAPG